MPSQEEFMRRAREANVVPLVREFSPQEETPLSLYRRLAAEPYSFLLESVEGEERIARYSFLGSDPFLIFRSRGERVELERDGAVTVREGNPLEILREVLAGFSGAAMPELPRFWGGAVGYLGYDLVRFVERLPAPPPDDLELPDSVLIFPRRVFIFDHLEHRAWSVAVAPVDGDPAAAYRRALDLLDAPLPPPREILRGAGGPTGVPVSPVDRERFGSWVARAKEYIRAGDIFQVVLSHRLEAPTTAGGLVVYRQLRRLNPSPYMFLLHYPDFELTGASPEMLVRLEDGILRTRPLAGTRARDADPAEDRRLERDLLADAKERAEHVMLVDLGRNDLGRVCVPGSVRVTRLLQVERYSHVMHLSSEVEGRLEPDHTPVDVVAACLPAGTLSGAPKVRAMEIIDELELTRRGPYGGAVGYFGFTGNLDTCITIRTVLLKGGRAYVQAGAGIVADSDPEREYQETLNKAGAVLKALELAGGERP